MFAENLKNKIDKKAALKESDLLNG